jgi:hypothetical protein
VDGVFDENESLQHAGRLSLLMLAQWSIPPAAAQDRFAGEASVTVVEVPVRVVDRTTGRPVVGLTATDFVVLENGRPMEISNFAEIGGSTLPVRGAAAADLEEHVRQMVFFFDLLSDEGQRPGSRGAGAGRGDRRRRRGSQYRGFHRELRRTLRTHLDRSRDARRVRRPHRGG